MARIRTIKPEFPQSESMGRISRDARLLFIMLFTVVDDSGITRGNSRMLASLLFPYDEDVFTLIDGWFYELESEGCIVRYIADGLTYLQICNWLNHQKIDKPTPSKLPVFDSSREDSRILPVGRDRIGMDRNGVEASRDESLPPKKTDLKILTDLGVPEQTAKDWLKVRKAKRAPLTETALSELQTEAFKAGISVMQAVTICARKSWQGFNSTWNWKDDPNHGKSQSVQEARLDTARQIFGGKNGTNKQNFNIDSIRTIEGDGESFPEAIPRIR